MIAPEAGSDVWVDQQLGVACQRHGARRLWSLWELMFVIDAARLLSVSNWLTTLSQVMRAGGSMTINLHTIQSLRRDIAHLKYEFSVLGMDASEISAARLDKGLEKLEQQGKTAPVILKGDELASMNRLCGEVTLRATDQMQSRLVLVIRPERKRFYEQTFPLFGSIVADKFPSAAYDIEEAGKCFALERSTATAFHAIRCLESGIRAISRCLGISDPTKPSDRSWFKALQTIKNAIDGHRAHNKSSPDSRMFDEMHAMLHAMQNPYRNDTMHLDRKYTEEEAEILLNAVGVFMKKLSERCDENGLPKI